MNAFCTLPTDRKGDQLSERFTSIPAPCEHKVNSVNVFRNRELPETAKPAGYAVLLDRYALKVPLPQRLAAISDRSRPEETSEWLLLPRSHEGPDTLKGHLEFALKWEGVDLSILNALFATAPSADIAKIVEASPTGSYARRIWFLYEWLAEKELDVPEAPKVRAVPVLDTKQQYGIANRQISSRHKVRNNLPGTRDFCPLIRRTTKLQNYEELHLDQQARTLIGKTHPDIVHRAAAFLLLDDSRASFRIEGEQPSTDRAARWARTIENAGLRPLATDELDRLQRELIPDRRFVELGLRREGGFVGKHDRVTRDPLPEHISARAEDLRDLLAGIVTYEERALAGGIDPVIVAAAVSFGFVFVHPYEDGNGRIHRWLIHHTLAAAGYNPPGIVFPISAALLRRLADYRSTLQTFSKPLLELIKWRPTTQGNVEVLNETGDYYRFFDVTPQAEFLYECVDETVKRDLPDEVAFLESYDRFGREVQAIVDLPNRTVDLLVQFLRQGGGQLSKRAREREFKKLEDHERHEIEELFAECFADEGRVSQQD